MTFPLPLEASMPVILAPAPTRPASMEHRQRPRMVEATPPLASCWDILERRTLATDGGPDVFDTLQRRVESSESAK